MFIPSSTILTVCFFIIFALILTNKMNRVVVTLSGALVTYFVLTFIEGKDFSVIVGLLFGTQDDGYVNLRSLILIIGMMIIIQIAEESGVFQFLSAFVIKRSNGHPVKLLIIFCFLAVACSAILNSLVTILMLIPLTITITRILNTNPVPYILSETVMFNLGSTVFPISSIANILITTNAGIGFREYLFNVGLFSIFVAFMTVPLLWFLYKPQLVHPDKELVDILVEFDVWNVVQSKRMFSFSTLSIIVLILAFLIIPPTILPLDMIALFLAGIMLIIAHFQGIDNDEVLKKINYQLLLYLICIFLITGGLEVTGVIESIELVVRNLSGNYSPIVQILFILWASAILGSFVDNIPITKLLIPIVHNLVPVGTSGFVEKVYFYSLSIGANWGENLVPLGDNILVVNLAEQHKRPISLVDFWRLGFFITLYELFLASLYFIFLFDMFIGLLLWTVLVLTVLGLGLSLKSNYQGILILKQKIRNLIVG